MNSLPDLQLTLERLKSGLTSSSEEIERAVAAAKSPANQHTFIKPLFDEARVTVSNPAVSNLPLAGLSVSVKDLFDLQGQSTAAGSRILGQAPVAAHDAVAISRLRDAGASIIGRTNMSEFAFSGVGINPHYGTPRNAAWSDQARIPGGSSSGAAVSVATGAAFIGLGSDTGGSIRIPAALNGIVGFKCTARRVPLEGTLPLSFTLDTVCALTRSVTDAILAHEILSARKVIRQAKPLAAMRLAVPHSVMLEAMEPPVALAFENSLKKLRRTGAQVDEIGLAELSELDSMQAQGSFSPAESYAWHRHLIGTQSANYDPRVLVRILRGKNMSSSDYIDLLLARRHWITKMESALHGYDGLLSPTVPIIAPLISDVAPGAERDEAFFKINSLLLRNTSAINMLDGCAISIPCQTGDAAPVGLMVWHCAMRDDSVLSLALAIEKLLQNK